MRLTACRRRLSLRGTRVPGRSVYPHEGTAPFARSPVCRSGGVFLVGHVFEPGHDLALVVGLLYGDVGHEPAGGGTVPVLLAGLDVDDVPGADLLRLAPRRAT
jgi:hypothetical protein